MKHECVDEQFTELLTAARPELSARWQDRVLAKVAAPATHRTRRWMAIAVGAAVALIGLGLLPLRPESAKSILGRAAAAMEQASSVHFAGYVAGWDDDSPTGRKMAPEKTEYWASDRAFATRTTDPDGAVVVTSGVSLDTNEKWFYDAYDGVCYAAELTPQVASREAASVSYTSRVLRGESLELLQPRNLSEVEESVTTEVRDGRRVLLVTYSGVVRNSPHLVRERLVCTIDEATEHLISLRLYAQADGYPKDLISQFEVIEYDVPVPTDLAPVGAPRQRATLEVEETDKGTRWIMKVGDRVVYEAESVKAQ
jgi:hypothetical protein